jgi:hypothetical protein
MNAEVFYGTFTDMPTDPHDLTFDELVQIVSLSIAVHRGSCVEPADMLV